MSPRKGIASDRRQVGVDRCCLALVAASLLAACTPPPEAGSGEPQAAQRPDAGSPSLTDTAHATILAWARERLGAAVYEPIAIFRGDFTGDGAADALAWVLYPSGGNSNFLRVELFRDETGRLVHHRSVDDVFGSEPRDVVFVPGRITLTSTMPRPGDPRCCPSGSQDWVIDTD